MYKLQGDGGNPLSLNYSYDNNVTIYIWVAPLYSNLLQFTSALAFVIAVFQVPTSLLNFLLGTAIVMSCSLIYETELAGVTSSDLKLVFFLLAF